MVGGGWWWVWGGGWGGRASREPCARLLREVMIVVCIAREDNPYM